MFWEWLIISITIFASLSYFIKKKKKKNTDDLLFVYIVPILLGGIFFCAIMFVVLVNAPNVINEIKIADYPLVAMKHTSEIKGAFSGNIFASTGWVGTEQSYVYYYQQGNATYYGTSPICTPVFEENRTDALLVKYQTIRTYLPTAFDPLLKPDYNSVLIREREEIHAPVGTIERGSSLGL
jgi:hypothetical protein